jgi:hypothetical protein
MVGGRHVTPLLPFLEINPGAYDFKVEVYRNNADTYTYDPITFYWQSSCDTNPNQLFISRNFTITVSYVRPCAKAEFYSLDFNTFKVDSTKFVVRVI